MFTTVIKPSFIIPFLLIFQSGITVESSRHSNINQHDSETMIVETVHGDIYDCVDVHKQPSLDHPDLQGHKVKMTPGHKHATKLLNTAEDQDNYSIKHILLDQNILWKSGKGCPQGTVPIPKKTADTSSPNNNVPANQNASKDPLSSSKIVEGFHGVDFVGLISGPDKTFYGASAFINLQNPTNFLADEYSSALITVMGADNEIHVGWAVHPPLYKDYRTRLFTQWAGRNGQGCCNHECPGFISVNNNIPLDLVFSVTSIKGGDQYDVDLAIELDPTHGWWLMLGDLIKGTPVGYWPLELFDAIRDGAAAVRFGGEVMTPMNEWKAPPMGTGEFNKGFNNNTCYMRRVFVIDEGTYVIDADDSIFNLIDNSRGVYFAGEASVKKNNEFLRSSFTFGGSGYMELKCC